MSNGALTVLRQYAQKRNPSTLPPSLYFSHTDATLTIFDTFPKALFHFLVLPRPAHYQPRGLSVFDLASLRALLRKTENRERGREVLLDLRAEGARLRGVIEEEMRKRYGFVWGVWMGFHAVPSMEHLHLHVISADLCSERLKHKKHYNSFHPARGFFLPLDDVLAWYDAAPSYFDTVSQLKKSEYEPRLKEDLVCFRCERALKNMPALKAHLQEEWDALRARGRRAASKAQGHGDAHKRKRDADVDVDSETAAAAAERRETSEGAPHAKKAAVDLLADP